VPTSRPLTRSRRPQQSLLPVVELANGEEGKAALRYTISSDYSIDVRKTDSVLSPFEGTVTVPTEAEGRYEYAPGKSELLTDDSFHGTIVARFVYQDGKWVFKSAEQIGRRGTSSDVASKDMTGSKRIQSAVQQALSS
jgi:hypothetical protein